MRDDDCEVKLFSCSVSCSVNWWIWQSGKSSGGDVSLLASGTSTGVEEEEDSMGVRRRGRKKSLGIGEDTERGGRSTFLGLPRFFSFVPSFRLSRFISVCAELLKQKHKQKKTYLIISITRGQNQKQRGDCP